MAAVKAESQALPGEPHTCELVGRLASNMVAKLLGFLLLKCSAVRSKLTQTY